MEHARYSPENPDGFVCFDRLRAQDFGPAIQAGLAQARAAIAAIVANPAVPDFTNTVAALEQSDEDLALASATFHNLLSVDGTEAMHELAPQIAVELAQHQNDVYLNPQLYRRVAAVWQQRGSMPAPERRLTELMHKAFVRNGAALDVSQQARLRQIDARLAELGPEFGRRLLKAMQQYVLPVADAAQLEGLPQLQLAAAAQAARDRGLSEPYALTLQAPSLMPALTYCHDRVLRERLYRAYIARATQGESDNRAVCTELAQLRVQRAQLLGYATHAHFTLDDRMAERPESVVWLAEQLALRALPAARREHAQLQQYARRHGAPTLAAWDIAYWAERLKHELFDFDEERLRPWFELERTVEGAFAVCQRLWGLRFEPRADAVTWAADVRLYTVRDDDGSLLGYLYVDLFPRATKRPGAWMTSFRDQGLWQGQERRPHIAIVGNFTPPQPGHPTLLAFSEVETLFHELGHALHGLLSQVHYRSMAGTNVAWDFVELPSQLMENWLRAPQALALFARHYQTGAPLPAAYVEALAAERRYRAGTACARQLSFGALDMAWHSLTQPERLTSDQALELERHSMRPYQILLPLPEAQVSPSFSHIFDGGYSAGYYSYKWAEVLEADAWQQFEQAGVFDPATAQRYRRTILARGNSVPAEQAWLDFRGQAADVHALINRDQLDGPL